MPTNPHHNYCLNCQSDLPAEYDGSKEVFCITCGQSTKDSRLSFFKLVKDGISNIFDLDSRLVHTFRDILSPSKLTKAYIAGRRKYYVNPVRLFVFTLLAVIAISIYMMNHGAANLNFDSLQTKSAKSHLLTKYNKLVDTLEHKDVTDTIRAKLFKSVYAIDQDTFGSQVTITFFGSADKLKSYGISSYDAVNLTLDEVYDKYKVEGFWTQMLVGQYIRILSDPTGTIYFCIKNITWAIVLTLLFIGFIMKLIYIRGRYYLVEHMVLTLNFHSLLNSLFLILILIMALVRLLSENINEVVYRNFTLTYVALIFILQFITLKKYYQQGIFKTGIKMSLINVSYILIFAISATLVSFVSIILY